ncbi:hypothetical protein [Methylobacterium fujisawaense]|uniref:hypothetical protein n=1 Tax=Methylobacterium fujisawaense TaxID=107400 RepID=UPI00313B2E25
MARPAPSRSAPHLASSATLDARYAAARQAAKAAEDAVRQASARHLADLLRAKPEVRFAALVDNVSILTPEDRTQLLTSMRGGAPPSRPILAGTASHWAIWRSRLPYRAVALAVRGLLLVAGLGLGALAWHHTPERWVSIAGDRDLSSRWQWPGGQITEGVLRPGEHYLLVRRDGEVGLLRHWSAEYGYAEIRVPLAYLR